MLISFDIARIAAGSDDGAIGAAIADNSKLGARTEKTIATASILCEIVRRKLVDLCSKH